MNCNRIPGVFGCFCPCLLMWQSADKIGENPLLYCLGGFFCPMMVPLRYKTREKFGIQVGAQNLLIIFKLMHHIHSSCVLILVMRVVSLDNVRIVHNSIVERDKSLFLFSERYYLRHNFVRLLLLRRALQLPGGQRTQDERTVKHVME